MPVTLYRDINYEGPVVRLQPGFYSGPRALEGKVRGSSSGENLDNEVSSIRVDQGYIAVLFSSTIANPGGLAGGARTLIGPTEIPDLGAVGMDDKTSAVRVILYEPFRSAVPRDFGVTLFSWAYPRQSGRIAAGGVHLGQGDFDRSRLDSDEIRIGSGGIKSLCVGPNTIAVLYEGNNFESTMNSVVVLPDECIDSTADLRMNSSGSNDSGINSIRVLYAEMSGDDSPQTWTAGRSPFETAVSTLGTPPDPRFPPPTRIPLLDKAPPQPPVVVERIVVQQPSNPFGSQTILFLVLLLLVVILAMRLTPGGSAPQKSISREQAPLKVTPRI